MVNEEFRMKVENRDENKIPVKLLFIILITTMVLSLVVSYVIVNYGSSERDYSSSSGRIIVDVVDSESEVLFTAGGKIAVEIVDDEGDDKGE